VTANIRICTDDESAHLAIAYLLRRPSHIPPLNTPGRPYLLDIISAIRAREATRASTTIRHIRSHTGNCDLASIGNEAADRGVRLSTQFDNHADAPSHHDTPDNPTFELTYVYVVYILTPHLDIKSDPLTFTFQQDRIHGSIKDSLRDHFLSIQRKVWATKADRGLFLSSYAKETSNLIKNLWRMPSANHLLLLLTLLVNTSPHTYHTTAERTKQICPYCGTREPMTPYHSLYICPAMGDLWHQARAEI
jgi:hypothetical protein